LDCSAIEEEEEEGGGGGEEEEKDEEEEDEKWKKKKIRLMTHTILRNICTCVSLRFGVDWETKSIFFVHRERV
jgi:hypothetical protein